MSLVVCNDGDIAFLDDVANGSLMGAFLRLYVNAHTPVEGDTVAAYTEATYPGYAGVSMLGWSSAYLNVGGKAQVDHAMVTFTAGLIVTPEDVYGIYVTDGAGNLLYAEEDPAGPVNINTPGQTYTYTPAVTGNTE